MFTEEQQKMWDMLELEVKKALSKTHATEEISANVLKEAYDTIVKFYTAKEV